MYKKYLGGRAVYKLYGSTRQQIQRTSPRTLGAMLGVALVAFTAIALSMSTVAVHAITPPLILGELPYQKLISVPLSNQGSLEVNVANGNVILKTQDLNLKSVGVGLSVTRYFNNLGSGSGQAGAKDTLGMGADITITANSNGSATYQGPSGFKVTFPSNGAGGYTVPAEFTEASLVAVAGGGWVLTYHASNESLNFNSAGQLTSDEDASGNALDYFYNTNGTLAKVTDAQGKDTLFTNYSGTKVGTITDELGRTFNYTYNTSGQLTKIVDTRGNDWTFEYTSGNLTEIADPRGIFTTLVYDSSNRVTSITYNDYTSKYAEWDYAYNNGNTVVTDARGNNTTYTYDGSGRVTDVLDAVGAHHGATWDANNNQTAVTDPAGQATTSTFDSLNRLTGVQNPNTSGGAPGAQNSAQYSDPNHPYLPSGGTDAAGNQVAYSYNTNGVLNSTTSTSSGSTGMGTVTNKLQDDPNGSGGTINCGAYTGQVCTSIDARGNSTTYTYDSSGNVLTVTPPSPAGATTYTYDDVSRPITITDGNGSKRTITYTDSDQIKKILYANDGSSVVFTYDEDGNVLTRVDAAGTATYTYNNFNKVTKLQQTGKPDLTYTYDANQNLKTEVGPAGTITYTYDAANQLTKVNQSINSADETFTYTNGRVTSVGLPGGITQTIGYDNAGRETSIKAMKGATVLTDYTASYAKSTGQDTELMQTETNNSTGITSTYSYDGLNRLVGVTGTGTGANSYTYTYDNNGNRTQYTANGVNSPVFGFNAANELTTAGGGAYGSFDAAGNQTLTGGNLAMGYNAKNQTTSFTPSGGSAITAAYNDAGQVGRTQFGSTAQLNGMLGLYKDTTGSTAIYYTHMPTGSGQIIGQVVNGTAYYYLTDLRGSIVKMTSGSGVTQNTYSYDPYGNLLSSTGTVTNAIRYAGGYYDTSTALYKYGARYYNPSTATWTQLDPSGKSAAYIYAGDDPVNYTDVSGHEPCAYGLTPAGTGCANLPGASASPSSSPTTPAECEQATRSLGILLGVAGLVTTGPVAVGIGVIGVGTTAFPTQLNTLLC